MTEHSSGGTPKINTIFALILGLTAPASIPTDELSQRMDRTAFSNTNSSYILVCNEESPQKTQLQTITCPIPTVERPLFNQTQTEETPSSPHVNNLLFLFSTEAWDLCVTSYPAKANLQSWKLAPTMIEILCIGPRLDL